MEFYDKLRKYFWFLVYLLKRPFRRAMVLADAKKIAALSVSQTVSGDLAKDLVLSLSYKVDNETRFKIMETALGRTFALLNAPQLQLKVGDGSGPEFLPKNRQQVQSLAKLSVDYRPLAKKFAQSHRELLSDCSQPFFSMLFEDQPIIGLTDDFLRSSCSLLEDFNGLVGAVLIESAFKFSVNHGTKTVRFNLGTLDFNNRGIKPIRRVTYSKYSFAILANFHYKFFFNTLIADRKKYLSYLDWFTAHISGDDVHKMELASAAGIGPGFDFIAVPLEVFMMNLDYAHTQNSVRGQGGEERELFEALSGGYQVITK
jgi:hypothetical protein